MLDDVVIVDWGMLFTILLLILTDSYWLGEAFRTPEMVTDFGKPACCCCCGCCWIMIWCCWCWNCWVNCEGSAVMGKIVLSPPWFTLFEALGFRTLGVVPWPRRLPLPPPGVAFRPTGVIGGGISCKFGSWATWGWIEKENMFLKQARTSSHNINAGFTGKS